ncbi:23S rRNA (adenine(2030)-N(6))-methyltransferase RlmJ [Aestuariivirga sp.]|uniref:23S rRNA (adenine(2030)-N(6))-methyltransferase RlmJ n=1 Tax=Aestuariivirga sp. TaxID=2650926 RepID=UPI003BAA9FE6
MNYRHAYHAGNHADVLKHTVMARVLEHLKKKDKPFRVIDAHAGIGLYDLTGTEAGKTGEWEGGIAKMAEAFAPEVEALLAPYRAVIAALNPDGALKVYPGSPELALRLMRRGDRMIANELHPQDAITLERHYLHDPRVDVTSMDAETCLKAKLPPPERRGLILIDPPYELKTEAEKTVRMLAHAVRRFAQGVCLVWYPLKAGETAETVLSGIKGLGVPGTLKIELRVREAFSAGGLAGSGLAILNTPWTLDAELRLLLPALATRLGIGTWGESSVEWLVSPT